MRTSPGDRWLLVSLIVFLACAAVLAGLFAYHWSQRPPSPPTSMQEPPRPGVVQAWLHPRG